MGIEIREFSVRDQGLLRDFLGLVEEVYRDDPHFVRPLDMDVAGRLDQKKNPFFDHGKASYWVAYREGRPVGRITAQIDELHVERHGEKVGFFGFFDTIDDAEVAGALLETAERWLRARGMERMRGPISMSINEEVGCLVEGFDSPPMMMMPHHRPYQGPLIEQAGLDKCKDLYAWSYEVGKVPPRAKRGHEQIAALPEVRSRPVDMKRLGEEMAVLMEIFNDAWGDNWGFVPATKRECDKMAEDLKLIAVADLSRLVFIDGEPAALSLAVPNINDAIADLHGKLFPLGFAKLLWRLKVKGLESGRLLMLGIRKKYRAVRKYAGLSAYLYVETNKAGEKLGMKRAELSWTLEDNGAVNAGIRMMGGRIYKRYRIYEKSIAGEG